MEIWLVGGGGRWCQNGLEFACGYPEAQMAKSLGTPCAFPATNVCVEDRCEFAGVHGRVKVPHTKEKRKKKTLKCHPPPTCACTHDKLCWCRSVILCTPLSTKSQRAWRQRNGIDSTSPIRWHCRLQRRGRKGNPSSSTCTQETNEKSFVDSTTCVWRPDVRHQSYRQQ